MRALTLYEKILLAHNKGREFSPGDILEVDIDKMMIHDFFTPFCIQKFYEMGFKKVIDPDRVVFVYDHLIPTTFLDDVRHHRETEKFAEEQGITQVHRSDGVCHQLMHEQGYLKPGDIVLGTDSHTVTYGGIGVFATGIGYTEMAAVLGTGKLWLKAVPSIRINIEGKLPQGVSSKDIILKVIADLKVDGASYKVMEFSGSTIRDMSISSRLTIANMTVEAGAKAGLFPADEKTAYYLKAFYPPQSLQYLKSDPNAQYAATLEYKAEDFDIVAACPHNIDNVKPVAALQNLFIDQAFIGSCTNGRLEDLESAAFILKGRKVASTVRLIVVPASRQIYREALQKGFIQTLVAAGAIISHPACGLCAGRSGGVLEDGDRIISTNNRNFLGRMGGKAVEIFLGSPATVAASAIEGKIASPLRYLSS